MIVTYLGQGAFRLQSGETTVLVDPQSARFKADVVLRTSSPAEANVPAPNEISFPGEYETKNLEIQGWPLPGEPSQKAMRVAYLVRWEDITIAVPGGLTKTSDGGFFEKIGEADVLLLPSAGDHPLSPEPAAKAIKQLDTRLVIANSAKGVRELAKILGQTAEAHEKCVFKKKDLMKEKTRLVVLTDGDSK